MRHVLFDNLKPKLGQRVVAVAESIDKVRSEWPHAVHGPGISESLSKSRRKQPPTCGSSRDLFLARRAKASAQRQLIGEDRISQSAACNGTQERHCTGEATRCSANASQEALPHQGQGPGSSATAAAGIGRDSLAAGPASPHAPSGSTSDLACAISSSIWSACSRIAGSEWVTRLFHF